jgi:hypothetical protein
VSSDTFLEEFKGAHKTFPVSGPQRLAIAEEIAGGKPFSVHGGEKLFMNDFMTPSNLRVQTGEHPWDAYESVGVGGVYGEFRPKCKNLFAAEPPHSDLTETKELYNPNGLSDKEIMLARCKDENDVANDFTERLENIETRRPLNDIKNFDREFHRSSLRNLRCELEKEFFMNTDEPRGASPRSTRRPPPLYLSFAWSSTSPMLSVHGRRIRPSRGTTLLYGKWF